MSSIDERVVQMKFDNGQFESGVSKTSSSLDKLKKSLHLEDAVGSLNDLQRAGDRFNLSGIASGVEQMSSKFTALGVVGVTALANIANRAINVGATLVKSLTVDPIADGFADYGRKLTSVQTIMNATGASIGKVNGYFTQLDTYADKTIYNLSDMTGAFAKFTNAGIGMDKSVPAIKGIANMVALAGQDAGAASIAMYNLSQSMAGGFLTTMDYKSLNLANVATKEWKEQMAEGAVAAGTLKKAGKGMWTLKGSDKAVSTAALFNDELKNGWATTDVMIKVLGDYGNTNTAIGKKAQAAAQDVKSFSMMMDTLKASVGTGWTDTFEILVGNVTEAKQLFTPLTNTISTILSQSSDARNKLLKDWKDAGGRTAAIESIKNIFNAFLPIAKEIKQTFREFFPSIQGKNLAALTKQFEQFTRTLMPTPEVIDKIARTFAGIFAVLDIGRMILVGAAKMFIGLFKQVAPAGGSILDITANIGDFLVSVQNAIRDGEGLTKFFDVLGTILSYPVKMVTLLIAGIAGLVSGFGAVAGGAGAAAAQTMDNIGERATPLTRVITFLSALFGHLGGIASEVWTRILPAINQLGTMLGNLGGQIGESLKNVDFSLVLDTINTALFGGIFVLIKNFLKKKPGGKIGGGFLESIKGIFDGLTGTLQAMQTNLKAAALQKIAIALALLTASVLVLSLIDSARLAAALTAMTVMFTELGLALAVFQKVTSATGAAKLAAMSVALIGLAIAIDLLVIAVAALAALDWGQLTRGLLGLGVMLGLLAGFSKMMQSSAKNLIPFGIGLIFVATAIDIMTIAVGKLAAMDLGAMVQGLVGLAVILAAIAGFSKIMDPAKMLTTGLGLILLGTALNIMATALQTLGSMSAESLATGLAGMAGALLIVAGAVLAMPGPSLILTAAGLVVVGAALVIIAQAMTTFGSLSWEQLAISLLALAGSLVIIAGALYLMTGALPGAAALIIAAGALAIMAPVLVQLGGMSWEQIGAGLVMLGGALLIIAVGANAMSGAIGGAAAMLIMAGALTVLTPVLVTLGSMPIEQIILALVALAGAFAVIGVAGLLLTPVLPTLIGLGIAISLLGLGAALAGVGVLAFSVGLVALGAAGVAGAVGLTAVFTAILNLIPLALTKLGEGIVALAGVIEKGAPAIVRAFMAILMSLILSITDNAPKIAKALVEMMVKLMKILSDNVPKMVKAGMKLLAGILKGIADNIDDVADQATRVIQKFMGAIGRNGPKIADSGAKMIIKFVNGLADAVRKNTEDMKKAGLNLADAIVDGMTSGITDGVDAVVKAAQKIAGAALDTVKNFLGIASPSKEFYKLGEFVNEGFYLGLTSGSQDKVRDAFTNMKTMVHDLVESTQSDVDAANEKLARLGETKTDNQDAIDKQRRKITTLKTARDDKKEVTAATKRVNTLTAKRTRDTYAIRRAQIALTKATAAQKDHNDVTVAAHRLAQAKAAKHPSGFAIDQAERALKRARAKHKDTTAVDDAREALRVANARKKQDDADITVARKAVTAAKNSKVEKQAVTDAETALDNLIRARDANNASITATQEELAQAISENEAAIRANGLLTDELVTQQEALDMLSGKFETNHDNLEKARDDYTQLIDEAKAYTKSVTDQYHTLESFNATDPNTDMQISVDAYMKNLKKKIDDTVLFTAQLAELRSRGLNNNIYEQLVGEGLDAMPFVTDLLSKGKNGVAELNALDTGLEKAASALGVTASKELKAAGIAAAEGIVQGFQSQETNLQNQMNRIAGGMVDAIKRELQIRSPSRVFAKIGGQSAEGIAQGLDHASTIVENSAAGLGQSAVNSLQSTLSGVADNLNANMDVDPTIRPVLDLSAIQKDAGLIGGILGTPSLGVNGTYSAATSASNGYSSNQDAITAAKEAVASSSGGVTFVQNNNSPKALSASEIYRNTKNQISVVKGALTTK